MSRILLMKLKGERVAEKGAGKTVDVELYFDPENCTTYAVVNGEIAASTVCSITDIAYRLLDKGIRIKKSGLPSLEEIYSPDEVEAKLDAMKRLAEKGWEIDEYRGSFVRHITIKAARRVSDDRFDVIFIIFTDGDTSVFVSTETYFVVRRNGDTVLIRLWNSDLFNGTWLWKGSLYGWNPDLTSSLP